MSSGFTLTVRVGPRVERQRFATLEEALAELEVRLAEIRRTTRRAPVDLHVRRFEPVAQVAARLEVSGPGRLRPTIRAGVDVRGDGSAEAYAGRASRAALDPGEGEDAVAALRSALAAAEPGESSG